MCRQWKDKLSGSPDGAIILVSKWLARTTLDVIGEGRSTAPTSLIYMLKAYLYSAAFDFKFGALDDDHNAVSDAYNNMLCVLCYLAVGSIST